MATFGYVQRIVSLQKVIYSIKYPKTPTFIGRKGLTVYRPEFLNDFVVTLLITKVE